MEKDFASFLDADFVSEGGKGAGVGEIDVGVRFAAVAVAAGDERQVGSGGHVDDTAILGPGAEPVELQGMEIR